jgi:hypothetical protein
VLASAKRVVWVCSCRKGGVCTPIGTKLAIDVAKAEAESHLNTREAEGHGITIGLAVAEVSVDRKPRPLVVELYKHLGDQ